MLEACNRRAGANLGEAAGIRASRRNGWPARATAVRRYVPKVRILRNYFGPLSETGVERRACPRVPLQWALSIRRQEREEPVISSITENLSSHGFFCLADRPLAARRKCGVCYQASVPARVARLASFVLSSASRLGQSRGGWTLRYCVPDRRLFRRLICIFPFLFISPPKTKGRIFLPSARCLRSPLVGCHEPSAAAMCFRKFPIGFPENP